MAVTITITNVPDEVRDTLAARAARNGQSLQEHLLAAIIETAGRPHPSDLLAAARRSTSRLGTRMPRNEILGHLDSDRE